MSLKKESFMKKAFCLLLAILLAAPLWTLPGTAAGEKPVITAPADGNVLAAGDVTIHWTAVSGADYYTVNIRYIENGENGPLAANAVPVDGTSYTLPEETTAALGNGAYRICVASVHGTEVRYSDTVTFRLADGNEPLLGKKAVFFGDSLTASFGWCRQLALRFGLEAVNAGVGGETSEMARARFEADVLAQSPDYVFICFGMNDQVHADHRNPRVSVERFAENITYFVTEAQRADAEVILITPNCVEESGYYTNPVHPESDYTAYGGVNAYLNRYCAKVREIASAYGTGLVDLFAEFWGRDLTLLLEPAGLHPIQAGYNLYADCAGAYLQARSVEDNVVATTVRFVSITGRVEPELCLLTAPGARVWLTAPNGTGGTVHTMQTTKLLRILLAAASGDVNLDGATTVADYLLLKRHFVLSQTLGPESQRNGDVNGDGRLTPADYLGLKRMLLG